MAMKRVRVAVNGYAVVGKSMDALPWTPCADPCGVQRGQADAGSRGGRQTE